MPRFGLSCPYERLLLIPYCTYLLPQNKLVTATGCLGLLGSEASHLTLCTL